jgi:hypothetical protein
VIRFRGHDSLGNRIVGIGITAETFSQMLQGKSIVVDLVHNGVPKVKLILRGGKDEAAITRDLQESIGQHTGIHVDPALIRRKQG